MYATRLCLAVSTALLLGPSVGVSRNAQEIPRRPEDIEFRPLVYEPPAAKEYRHELPGRVPVYLAPSHEFPLVTVSFSFRGGSYLEEKVGLAAMTGAMIRRGGTTSLSAEELDEELDFLAASCSTGPAGASINCLKSNFEHAFTLFLDMVKHPGFQGDKVRIHRDQILEGMKQRNDDADSILGREWGFLLYGEDHHAGRVATQASILSITEDDMRAYHGRVFQPGNLIVSATGDFEIEEMLNRLGQALEGWQAGERMPTPPPPTKRLEPGIYHVEKDIPQGKVSLGMRGVSRDHPDYFALLIMNDILGGGGFTSRILGRVRTDEGLAYNAGSAFTMPVWYPGEFRAWFQSKNRTVALAIQIIFEEIERIRTEQVPAAELETAKNKFIETFPRTFESREQMLGVFVDDEWTGREQGFWKSYRDRVRAVTADDVLRVARQHLRLEEMAILVVGKWEEIEPGDLDGRASMREFFGDRRTELPLRDPLTMRLPDN